LLHPAFEGAPGHQHWKALCSGGNAGDEGLAAGLFSVVFHERYSPAQVDAFCDALRLFKLGFSWGGPLSLVVPYDLASMRSAALGTWTQPGVLVRFSVGLEALEDLRADLEQALDRLDPA
jgi:cystathionine beta-lyase